jgi:hypothetical protein
MIQTKALKDLMHRTLRAHGFAAEHVLELADVPFATVDAAEAFHVDVLTAVQAFGASAEQMRQYVDAAIEHLFDLGGTGDDVTRDEHRRYAALCERFGFGYRGLHCDAHDMVHAAVPHTAH